VDLAFGPDGLAPAIAQDRLTGQVRMLGHMNAEAVARTLATSRATFFSRSRGVLWEKGETSGHALRVVSVVADCDADALLVLTDPIGPTCHTGSPSCFFRSLTARGAAEGAARDAAPVLEDLERTVLDRRAAPASTSYTKTLLDGGPARIGAKLREEADELARAVASESADAVASEAADVLYHVVVALASRGVPLRQALATLAARSGTSGLVEKAERR
jgi:phosphoribosyl-ATP pyrophosphohydrolase/phosphoribosyl-AMP cyclohydrolase